MPMRIRVRRIGGFAGLDEEVASVDTRAMSETAAGDIEHRVRATGFFDLPSRLDADEVGTDRVQRVVTIETGNDSHTVAYIEPFEDASKAAGGDLENVEEIVKRITETT